MTLSTLTSFSFYITHFNHFLLFSITSFPLWFYSPSICLSLSLSLALALVLSLSLSPPSIGLLFPIPVPVPMLPSIQYTKINITFTEKFGPVFASEGGSASLTATMHLEPNLANLQPDSQWYRDGKHHRNVDIQEQTYSGSTSSHDVPGWVLAY